MPSKSKQPSSPGAERRVDPAGISPPNTAQAEQSPTQRTPKRDRKVRATPENSIYAGGARSKAPPAGGDRDRTSREQSAAADGDSHAVPDHIKERYLQVGNRYHFPNGDPAFRDLGSRLTTKSENTEVVRDFIAIAEVRGWKNVTVGGTERFRKEAWQQARLAGLEVRGYRPSEVEQVQLARLIERERQRANELRVAEPLDREVGRAPAEADMPSQARDSAAAVDERVYRGRLVDHGPAAYQHDRQAAMSYFVTLDTPSGERTLWGKDLERAIKESLSQVKAGDEVAVRHLGERPVTVVRATRDAQGAVVGQTEVAAYRNRWLVENREFLARRAELARIVRDPSVDPREVTRRRPELAGTYQELRAAELVAKEVYSDQRDRERFVTRVRHAIAEEIERGQPLSAVRVREPAQQRVDVRTRVPERTQERVLN